jgi:hypothetical protein
VDLTMKDREGLRIEKLSEAGEIPEKEEEIHRRESDEISRSGNEGNHLEEGTMTPEAGSSQDLLKEDARGRQKSEGIGREVVRETAESLREGKGRDHRGKTVESHQNAVTEIAGHLQLKPLPENTGRNHQSTEKTTQSSEIHLHPSKVAENPRHRVDLHRQLHVKSSSMTLTMSVAWQSRKVSV